MTIREHLADEFQQLVAHIREHAPDAVINTRLAHADETTVVIHAQIVSSAGSAAGAHGSAEMQEGAAEIAENRALHRAMTAMGIPGLQELPLPRLHSVSASDNAGRVVQFPSPESPVVEPNPAVTPDVPAEPEVPPVPPVSNDPTAPPPVELPQPVEQADPAPEDISWTAFWKWAKANGFADKDAVETAIGQKIDALSPADIRRALMNKTPF
jgi:hypothetical protein